jgi:hypothetical protein
VAAACEKSLFASPATVAIATSYVAARLALLSDMVSYVKRGGGNIDSSLLPLRRSLEADRFGFVAHALALRDGCTSKDCPALDVLHDSSQVRANLSAATLDRYLDRYMAAWTQPADNAVADVTAAQQSAGPPAPHHIVNIDFPTAASIPPVSIMNPEPTGKSALPSAAAANANSVPADSQAPKRAKRQAANAPAPAPSGGSDAPVDPVWTPAPAGTTPQPASPTPAPAANMASGPTAPMQLTPQTQ